MAQLLMAVVLTVALVLFSMANTHHVELSYVFGEPIRIRLIFLVSIAFVAGALTAFFYGMVAGVLRRAEARRRRQTTQRFARGREPGRV